MKRILTFLISLYLLNRIGILLTEYLNKYIFIDLDIFKLDVNELKWDKSITDTSFRGWLLRILPFNIMYLYGYIFIMALNLLCLISYYRLKAYNISKVQALKQYYFCMILTYLGAYFIFFILRFLYFDADLAFTKTGDGILKLLCESYAPYSPTMITGFLLANILFGYILTYLLEPLFDKWLFKLTQ